MFRAVPTTEVNRRVDERLTELYERHRKLEDDAETTVYDARRGAESPQPGADRDRFGICLAAVDGQMFIAGDNEVPFPLQSISKVFTFGLALEDHGREEVLRHVGVEPSGDAFNSIVFDERNNRPFNPMVNAGALVTTSLVRGDGPGEKLERILAAMRRFAGNERIEVDEEIYAAELEAADLNRATAYLMRSQGMIEDDVEETIQSYLRHCAVAVTCDDLATMGATLANGGLNPLTGERAIPRENVRDVLSVMYTCGMYDAAGAWAYEVGVPAKSGVSGGILAVIPGKLGIAVYSPELDAHGNSVRGVRVCEEISDRLGLHVFAGEDEDTLLGAVDEER
jgi:glutaminase